MKRENGGAGNDGGCRGESRRPTQLEEKWGKVTGKQKSGKEKQDGGDR